ncbi:MAG TPA: DMT family transporter [Candidatus Acidoferrum sp.]|nr:DMT family transporter [Candidatus Acidoferrum sp.]
MTTTTARTAIATPTANHLRGILLMLGVGFSFTVLDATAKHLTQSLPVMEIAWGRYLFHLAVLPLFLGGQSLRSAFRSTRPGLQILRSTLLLGSTVFFFVAVKYIPLADATAIGFVSPLLVTGLSVPILGEQVGIRRWAAVIIGFASVLLIIRPGFGMVHWAMTLPLLTASCFSLYQITTRILSRSDSALTTYFFSATVGLAVTTACLPTLWVTPTFWEWVSLIFLGGAGGFSHYLLIRAFAIAPASLLAPFAYAQLIWSTTIGYLWFGDFPDLWTIGGGVLISLSGLYVLYRERRVAAGKGVATPGSSPAR